MTKVTLWTITVLLTTSGLWACDRGGGSSAGHNAASSATSSGASATSPPAPGSQKRGEKNFTLAVAAAPGCKSGQECAMTIKLVTGGGYHVNKEYPYKFIATPGAGLAYLGKTEPTTFSRAAGDFVEQSETAGVMTVRFKPAAAGDVKVAGKYKLSVCSADQCQIEEEPVELAVPVM
jgi:hypothetical protein